MGGGVLISVAPGTGFDRSNWNLSFWAQGCLLCCQDQTQDGHSLLCAAAAMGPTGQPGPPLGKGTEALSSPSTSPPLWQSTTCRCPRSGSPSLHMVGLLRVGPAATGTLSSACSLAGQGGHCLMPAGSGRLGQAGRPLPPSAKPAPQAGGRLTLTTCFSSSHTSLFCGTFPVKAVPPGLAAFLGGSCSDRRRAPQLPSQRGGGRHSCGCEQGVREPGWGWGRGQDAL